MKGIFLYLDPQPQCKTRCVKLVKSGRDLEGTNKWDTVSDVDKDINLTGLGIRILNHGELRKSLGSTVPKISLANNGFLISRSREESAFYYHPGSGADPEQVHQTLGHHFKLVRIDPQNGGDTLRYKFVPLSFRCVANIKSQGAMLIRIL